MFQFVPCHTLSKDERFVNMLNYEKATKLFMSTKQIFLSHINAV